jgi:hypothetical protein
MYLTEEQAISKGGEDKASVLLLTGMSGIGKTTVIRASPTRVQLQLVLCGGRLISINPPDDRWLISCVVVRQRACAM